MHHYHFAMSTTASQELYDYNNTYELYYTLHYVSGIE